MSVTATLGWESDIASGARRDARAASDLAKALATLGGQSGPVAAGLDRLAASSQALGAAQKASAVEAERLKLAQVQEKASAANISQRNAAMAKLIQQQAKANAQSALAREKAAAQEKAADAKQEAEAAKHAHKIEEIAAKHAAKMAELHSKEAKAAAGGKGGGGAAAAPGMADKLGGTLDSKFGGGVNLGGIGETLGTDLAGAPGLAGAIGVAVSAFKGIVEKLQELVMWTGKMLYAGGQMAIDAVSFKDTTVLGFEALTHSQSKAADLYEKVMDLSERTGQAREHVAAEVTKFISAGFSTEGALAAVRATADMAQVLGQGAANKLENVLTRIQATGKATQKDIAALGKAGIPVSQVYEEIGKKIGKTAKEAEAAVKAGQVGAKAAEEAIEAVVEKKFGGLAEKAGMTIPRLLGAIADQVRRLFDGIDLSPLKDTLKNISTILAGDEGKALKKDVTGLFNEIFLTLFGPTAGKEGAERLKTLINSIRESIQMLTAIVRMARPVVASFVDLIVSMSKAQSKAGGEGGPNPIGGGFRPTIEAANEAAPALNAVTTSLLGMNQAANDTSFADGIRGMLEAVQPQAVDTAMAIGQGFAQGIGQSSPEAESAAEAMAQRVLARMREVLGVHSPSREFSEIGAFSVAGFAGGFDDNAHHAANAAANMARGAVDAASGVGPVPSFAGGTAGRGGRAAGAAGGHTINVNVGAGASAQAGGDDALAQKIADAIDAKLRELGEAA